MQKHGHLVDLVKSLPTNIYLQNLASIQKRTSPIKFAHLAEKSEIGSISNFSTKVVGDAATGEATAAEAGRDATLKIQLQSSQAQAEAKALDGRVLRTPVNNFE